MSGGCGENIWNLRTSDLAGVAFLALQLAVPWVVAQGRNGRSVAEVVEVELLDVRDRAA